MADSAGEPAERGDMRHLDLFSGIGGFALSARWAGWDTVGFCEIEPFCQKVLRKHWPDVPIYEDVRELNGQSVGHVDIITAGYPCQPFSVAGERRGEEDDRHLWPEAARLVRELKPTFAVFENVAGHITMGLDQVLSDLEGLGYTTETFVIPACAVDAPHRRDRVWIVAYRDAGQRAQSADEMQAGRHAADNGGDVAHAPSEGRRPEGRTSEAIPEPGAEQRSAGCGGVVADAISERGRSGHSKGEYADNVGKPSRHSRDHAGRMEAWLPEPAVGRVANGIPRRVDRLRALGNAIVPQVAYQIFEAINESA